MSTVALSEIGQIALRVLDIPAATAFYGETLGMRHLFSAPTPASAPEPGMAFFDCGGIRLLLGLPEGGTGNHPGSTLYFRVPDIHAAAAGLRERGVAFIEGPAMVADLGHAELWLAFFRDPWDNPLALMAEVPK